KTFVYITHSLEEAMVMSDRIAIMKDGRFEQIAVADEIYSRPVSRFVAEFMGEVNLFEVATEDGKTLSGDGLAGPVPSGLSPGAASLLMVRPEYIRFAANGEAADYTVKGRLLEEYALGSRIQYEIETPTGQVLTVEKLREDRTQSDVGAEVTLGFDASNTHLIEAR
ncbi:MAG: TOBE domain-containing protein, partial [Pseudomonadota bacterium]